MLNIKNGFFLLITCSTILINQYAQAAYHVLNNFGENPGELTATYFASNTTSDNLVVLLHGCVQKGQVVAEKSGLLTQAKNKAFTLLIPQQNLNNNIKSCFNWFSLKDTKKDQGETLSIKNMIDALKFKVKAKNIYIIGISAGGALTSSIMLNYPNLFTAGAIVAGVPYPCADNLTKAISCMRNGPSQSVQELTSYAKVLNKKTKHWPRLSVWTGNADNVVNPLNTKYLALQWAGIHNIISSPTKIMMAGYQTTQWANNVQEVMVELVEIDDLGHGLAVNPDIEYGGEEAPFLIKSPISTVINIIDFWQIKS